MRILLTNDDGYFAKGLIAMAKRLAGIHKVYVVAPLREKSGAGHSLSFGAFSYQQIDSANTYDGLDVPCYAVDGSPADAVKFAVEHIYKGVKFDLVVSGINNVLNIGTDIIYSGTFGAAEEGTVLGIKSIAVSTDCKNDDYAYAADFIAENLEVLMRHTKAMVTINVNIPFTDGAQNKGVKIVEVGHRAYNDWYEPHGDGFKMTGYAYDCSEKDEETDCKYIDRGFITISPVNVKNCNKSILKKLEKENYKL